MFRRWKTILLILVLLASAPTLLKFDWGTWLSLGAGKLGNFKDDSKALVSGEYKDRVAESMRKEAADLKATAPVATDELNRELAEARAKLLEERAKALEKHKGEILKGDLDGLKRQVAENAKNSGATGQ